MTQQADNKNPERVKRRYTGVLLALVLVCLWILRGWPARICLTASIVLMVWEMYAAFSRHGEHPAKWVGLSYALLLLPAYLLGGVKAFIPLTAFICLAGLGAILLRGIPDYPSVAATLVPIIYPGLFTGLMFPLLDVQPAALSAIAFGLAFLIPLGNDVAAYEIGIRFGKHKLCPELSPKKSVEGAVAGAIASVIISIIIPPIVAAATRTSLSALPPLWHFSLIGLLGGILSPLGDLSASMIKRYCGIKDYGNLLPGHGGMMDRLDSVTFSIVVVYCWFSIVLGLI